MNEETIPAVPGTENTDYLQSSKTHALQAAEELKAAAALKAQQLREAAGQSVARIRETAEERTAQAREYATHQWENARTHAKDWQSQGEVFVRENPAKAVLAALGAGFVLGLIFRR